MYTRVVTGLHNSEFEEFSGDALEAIAATGAFDGTNLTVDHDLVSRLKHAFTNERYIEMCGTGFKPTEESEPNPLDRVAKRMVTESAPKQTGEKSVTVRVLDLHAMDLLNVSHDSILTQQIFSALEEEMAT
ncbi:MAG: hypothetical protein ACFE8Z_01655 [Candidatus Hermodarchaeota archaeon]